MAVNNKYQKVAYGLTDPFLNVGPLPIVSQRQPVSSDKAEIGTLWIYQPNNSAWILTSIVNNLANWEPLGGGTFVLTTLTGDSGGAVPPTLSNINITGVGAITTLGNPGASTISIAVTGGGLRWVDVKSDADLMGVNAGYVCDPGDGNLVVLTLPAVAPFGSIIRVVGKDTGGWQINQNAGQVIVSDLSTSTVGVAGTCSSVDSGSCVELVCSVANTEFRVLSTNGAILLA